MFLVVRCLETLNDQVVRWLARSGFDHCRIPMANVLFCEAAEGKVVLYDSLVPTHVIEGRLGIIKQIKTPAVKLVFHPNAFDTRECGKLRRTRGTIVPVADWQAVLAFLKQG
jgi:hypothetical protein